MRYIEIPVSIKLLPALFSVFLPVASTARVLEKSNATKQPQPNIIWITTEDLSPHLGCYGDTKAKTPNLDKFASQGTRFTNVFTTAAICSPCRAGIITGMYQNSIGCMHMRTTAYRKFEDTQLEFTTVPPHYVKAFTEYLRTAGYYCTNNSKTDYQFSKDPVPASIWDESSDKAHYRNRPKKDQPFFAVFNYMGTHEANTWDISNVKTDPKSVVVPPYYPDTEIVRRNIAKMYDNIEKLDSVVGVILAQLESDGLAENTIVYFYSDHGDGLPRAKRWLYDSGLKIPLIIRWPGNLKPGTVDNRLISSIDLGPTVLSMAGVNVPAHMQGIPFLGEQTGKERDAVYGTRDRVDESYDMIRSVRTKDFLYIRNYYPNEPFNIWVPFLNNGPIMKEMMRLDTEGKLNENQKKWMSDTRPAEELYYIKNDPFQLNNQVNNPKYKKILNSLRDDHIRWTHETGDMGHLNEPEMVEQMWPGLKQPVTDAPYFIVNAPEDRGAKNYRTGGAYSFPMSLALFCPTHGASIVYTFEETANPRWLLYNGSIHFKPGKNFIRIKAVRYGYKESEEVKGLFEIK